MSSKGDINLIGHSRGHKRGRSPSGGIDNQKRSESVHRRVRRNHNDEYSSGRRWANSRESRGRANRASVSADSARSSSHGDEIGHFICSPGDRIKDRYEIVHELGKGTFGKVFECRDEKYNDRVAVKVIRRVERYIDSARIEADILDDIYYKQKAEDRSLCVKMYSHFQFDGHYGMVFERLGISLFDLVKRNRYKRLPLRCVANVARQLLQALRFLRSMHLVHTDLKLENILFVPGELCSEVVQQAGRSISVQVPVLQEIKLIDFGGATYNDDHSKTRIINTRQYRGPEVTLELNWSYPSDVWSAGCIIAEIYSGELLFETHDELEHLALMERMVGPFPPELLRRCNRRLVNQYFHRSSSLVRVDELPRSSRRYVDDCTNLKSFFNLSPEDQQSGITELVRSMLRLDPDRRVTARDALNYSFLQLSDSLFEQAAVTVSGSSRNEKSCKPFKKNNCSSRINQVTAAHR